jgi:leucyl aminopeptidase
MQIELQQRPVRDIEADVLLLLGFETEVRDPEVNGATDGWLDEVYSSGEFTGKLFETASFHRPSGFKAKRLMLAGMGKPDTFGTFEMRRGIAAAIRAAKSRSLRRLHLHLGSPHARPDFVQAAVEGALTGDYEPDQLKTDKNKGDKRLKSFVLWVDAAAEELRQAARRGQVIAESQNFARDLTNEPSNLLPPQALADRATQMAAETGLECEVLDEGRMRQLGMGAMLGVAQGSDNPPALIVLRYSPDNPVSQDHLGFIGKGVTFDTGGVSIKPADGMEKMKYDMGGGAAVIGAMRAISHLRPPVRITALIPAVENMVSGRAQRPGDIVTTLSGKTVEVLNTDAEGRLILIDAITYALRLGCTHLVDAATLTGAIVVALGHLRVGAFTNNQELLERVRAAGDAGGERLWQMPLDEEYKDYLKSAFADIPNIGGRWGGSITAAMFLKEFVEDKPWVHLDIAGTAWMDDSKPWIAKGPSGVPVRTFVNLALNWAT